MPVHPVVDAPAPARAHEQAEAHAILAVIRALPEAYSETLVLRLVEGMTGEEIAERTGLTPGSVRVNLHRGMSPAREIDRMRESCNCRSRASGLSRRPRNAPYGCPSQLAL